VSKKQVKYELEQLSSLIDGDVTVSFILKNNSVYLAKPLSIKSDQVKIKNTKGHILDLPITQIEEIWGEEKATNS
tara:strand:- start:318 stop:542 length:225 start_codon:yes stop_codon:yes gene_type:complete